MTNEEILANTPEGATHITSNNVYLKVYGNYCHVFNSLHVWSIPITNIEDVSIRNNPRSLSDIRRIVELEKYNLGLAMESHELQQKLEAAERRIVELEKEVERLNAHSLVFDAVLTLNDDLKQKLEAAGRERDAALGFIASRIPTIESLCSKSDVAKIMKSEHLQALNKFAIEQKINSLNESSFYFSHDDRIDRVAIIHIEEEIEKLRQQLNGGE